MRWRRGPSLRGLALALALSTATLQGAAAQQAEAEAKEKGAWDYNRNGPRPFTSEVKEEIYRHFLAESRRLSPSTPITLCAETQRMWEILDEELGCKPWNYVCNCGPHCIPGIETIDSIEGPDAPRIAAARAANAIP